MWRAANPEVAGWTSWDTYATAYQTLTSHEAAGRRESNGRQGAGSRVRPPGTEHPPRAILAVNEGDHLNHLVRRSTHLAELLLQLAKKVSHASFSTGLALCCAVGCARKAHKVEDNAWAEACSGAPQAASLATLATLRPPMGVWCP